MKAAVLAAWIMCLVSSLHAQAPEDIQPLFVEHSIWQLLLHCALFGGLGVILVTAGFKFFDGIITKIDLEQEILKGNMAAAVLSAAAILAIGIIVAAAIH